MFTDDAAVREYTVLNDTKETEKQYHGLSDLLTRVNMTRDSMDEDEEYLPMNLTAIGYILLKFTNELSKGMVSILSICMCTHFVCTINLQSPCSLFYSGVSLLKKGL
jgi:hypothetical protein